jgi:UDPglucose 6-dehydrogenase
MKIAVAGIGYVGLSNAVLLAQHHDVIAVDISPERVASVNARQSPIADDELEQFLARPDLSITATLDGAAAYTGAEFIIVAAPTNYDAISTQHWSNRSSNWSYQSIKRPRLS